MDTSIPEIRTTSGKLGEQSTTSDKLGDKETTSDKPVRKPRTRAVAVIAILILLCVGTALLLRTRILFAAGQALINGSAPSHADMILVIGGDFTGERILEAAELEREGYAPVVLMSGGGSVYGFHETDLELEFVRDHGYGAEKFIQFRYPAESTVDEAEHDIPEMRKMGVHRYLLVTSPPHTARAGRVFRRVAPDLQMTAIACPDGNWVGGQWWKSREGRKEWLLESAKTLADWFRL